MLSLWGNQVTSGLNPAALLHTISKMNAWVKAISEKLFYDEGSNFHLYYFDLLYAISQYKADICVGVFWGLHVTEVWEASKE